MTLRPRQPERGPGALLSRLIVVLTLILFGAPQSHAGGTVAHGGPVAQSQNEQAQGILSVQRHLLRAQLHDDTSSNAVEPGRALDAGYQSPAEASLETCFSLVSIAVRILPPVRGPPAA